MSVRALKKEELETLSSKDVAYMVMEGSKRKLNTADLFKKVISLMGLPEDTFEKLITPQDYTDVMKKLTDYNVCSSYASKMLEQWETFRKKSETLDTLCSGGGVYDVVSKDVEEVMLRNMKLFMKV